MDGDAFRAALLAWYDQHQRPLPWRTRTDPYRTLVSEFMCQQTRVDVVVPFFERWMDKWPTLSDLAAANEEDVLAAWSGLGYYRRARNLHAAARAIEADGWPSDLRDLPGVGPYIAGAIASIAFDLPVAAIDGNVQRVLTRWRGLDGDVTKAAGRNEVAAVAEDLLRPERTGDWTQALMEFGATVCTPRARCDACPVAATCASRDDPAARPRRPSKAKPRDEDMHFAYICQDGAILLQRRGPGLLADTWGLPGGHRTEALADLVQEQIACTVRVGPAEHQLSHVFSHRRWTMHIHRAELVDGDVQGDALRWAQPADLTEMGVSTAMRRAIEAME